VVVVVVVTSMPKDRRAMLASPEVSVSNEFGIDMFSLLLLLLEEELLVLYP